MIDRQHRAIVFECDGCDETLETGETEFPDAMAHFRRDGWKASFDRLGRFAGALCGIKHNFNRSCNLPLGRPRCKHCLDVERRLSEAG